MLGAFVYFLFVPRFVYRPQEYSILIVIFIGTYVFPILLLFLLRRFRMIESYQMTGIEERKFPTLLFISLCYIMGNWLFKAGNVDLLALLFYGYGLLLVFNYLLFFAKLKLSLHTAAIGGLTGFVIVFSHFYRINMVFILSFLFLLGGIIGGARLRLKAHVLPEVFVGYVFGIVSQVIVYFIYLYVK
jgi:hypothetical protein